MDHSHISSSVWIKKTGLQRHGTIGLALDFHHGRDSFLSQPKLLSNYHVNANIHKYSVGHETYAQKYFVTVQVSVDSLIHTTAFNDTRHASVLMTNANSEYNVQCTIPEHVYIFQQTY